MKETKKISKNKKGELLVEIDTDNELRIPYLSEHVKIGDQKQKTYQTVYKEQIVVLKEFLNNQQSSIKKQMDEAKLELDRINYVDENIIPEKILAGIAKSVDKNKKLKKELIVLNEYVGNIIKKKRLIFKLTDLQKNYDACTSDIDAINKALK